MASLFRFIAKPPKDVYPLLGAVAVACGFGTFLIARNLTTNNDVIIDKNDKEQWTQSSRSTQPMYNFFLKEQNLITKSPEMGKLNVHDYRENK